MLEQNWSPVGESPTQCCIQDYVFDKAEVFRVFLSNRINI